MTWDTVCHGNSVLDNMVMDICILKNSFNLTVDFVSFSVRAIYDNNNNNFICKAPYILNNFCSEVHKIPCNTHIFKIFIISLNVHVKMKCQMIINR